MKEYKSTAGDIVAAATVNDEYQFTSTVRTSTASVCVSSKQSLVGVNSKSTGSAESCLLSVSPTTTKHQLLEYWPEFEESYNSIMDNTNLLDSCAAALSDINSGDDNTDSPQTQRKCRTQYNRSISLEQTFVTNSPVCSSNVSTCDSTSSKSVSTKSVAEFTEWLGEMEKKVEYQPTLSKTFTMTSDERAAQLKTHSKIFNEIVAQPCIVKGSKRNDYRAIEDRYHLLYLKVYEVLLLLEGQPDAAYSNSHRILNKSFYDFSCEKLNRIGNESDECCSEESNDKVANDDHSPSIYTQTNIMSTSIGTYYFNYDDKLHEQTALSDSDNNLLSSTTNEISDKEFTFENDLESLLSVSDNNYLNSNEHTLITEQHALQQQLTEETVVVSQTNHIWNQIDFCELVRRPTVSIEDNLWSDSVEYSRCKVRNWLNSKPDSVKSKSTFSLDRLTTNSDGEFRLIYRAKSDMDLPSSSFDSGQCSDTYSLDWDNFQEEHHQRNENEFSMDMGMGELEEKLCYFGDEYDLHLNTSLVSENNESYEPKSNESIKHIVSSGSYESADSLMAPNVDEAADQEKIQKRNRRRRAKRTKKQKQSNKSSSPKSLSQTESTSTSTLSDLSNATTLSANSMDFSFNNTTQTTLPEEIVPEQTIVYDSSDKQFELHTKDSSQPKKLKVNEMKPEDFYDIIKLCKNNLDCVITVLGADPNRILTVAYCQQMKFERYQKPNTNEPAVCNCTNKSLISGLIATKATDTNDDCECSLSTESETCVCAWVSQTVAMILNFLIDWWNIFRNMKLYTYLCRVIKAFFGSTRFVADHLKRQRQLANSKALKYL